MRRSIAVSVLAAVIASVLISAAPARAEEPSLEGFTVTVDEDTVGCTQTYLDAISLGNWSIDPSDIVSYTPPATINVNGNWVVNAALVTYSRIAVATSAYIACLV